MKLLPKSSPAKLADLLAYNALRIARRRRRERLLSRVEFGLLLIAAGVLVYGSIPGHWLRECPTWAQVLVWYSWFAAIYAYWCFRMETRKLC